MMIVRALHDPPPRVSGRRRPGIEGGGGGGFGEAGGFVVPAGFGLLAILIRAYRSRA